jgi:uncharacterized protein (TIGR03000 family)
MHTRNQLGGKIALLALLAMLWWQSPAEAQILGSWCRGVIIFAWTPYDWDETGLGNYFGRPPHNAGYGYYPGSIPGPHPPWMDGPGTPFDSRRTESPFPQAPVEDKVFPPDAALVIVKLPAEAELLFDETRTAQDGSYRRFVTPPLETGRQQVYTLRVRWHIKDADLTRVEKVQVEPGKSVTVNFLTVDSWTGVRAETLPPPRKLP